MKQCVYGMNHEGDWSRNNNDSNVVEIWVEINDNNSIKIRLRVYDFGVEIDGKFLEGWTDRPIEETGIGIKWIKKP